MIEKITFYNERLNHKIVFVTTIDKDRPRDAQILEILWNEIPDGYTYYPKTKK